MSGCIWLPYQMSLIVFVLIDPSFDPQSVDNSLIEDKTDSSSSELGLFSTKATYSKCAKVIM